MTAHVYIATNQTRGTLQAGVTTDLPQRIWQHREHRLGGSTERHGCAPLVSRTADADVHDAIAAGHRQRPRASTQT